MNVKKSFGLTGQPDVPLQVAKRNGGILRVPGVARRCSVPSTSGAAVIIVGWTTEPEQTTSAVWNRQGC